MQTLELFSGTGSFSKVAKERGHKTFMVEKDQYHDADLYADILDIQASDLPCNIDVLWASPPCTTFSVASLRHYWTNGKPKNWKTWMGISLVLKTFQLIKEIKPRYWFVENPRGMLRKQWFMQNIHKKTITYCQYGDFRQKPTDIWTNLFQWNARKPCKAGASCHASARRGEDKGTQSLSGSKDRSIIPPALFHEIFDVIAGNEYSNEQELLGYYKNKQIERREE